MKTAKQRSNSKSDKKIYISWYDYMDSVHTLCRKIKDSSYKFDFIYGIPRGGMVLAVSISHILDIPVLTYFDTAFKIKNVLICDDCCDTGKTLKKFKKYQTATIYKHEKSKVIPDFFVEENKNWIVFPYEEQKLL